jgi:hypothetical protein
MNKQRLDRFLTTPPVDPVEYYIEAVLEEFSEEFYLVQEELLLNSETVNNWFIKLEEQQREPEEAAAIIERLIKLYKL